MTDRPQMTQMSPPQGQTARDLKIVLDRIMSRTSGPRFRCDCKPQTACARCHGTGYYREHASAE